MHAAEMIEYVKWLNLLFKAAGFDSITRWTTSTKINVKRADENHIAILLLLLLLKSNRMLEHSDTFVQLPSCRELEYQSGFL